MNRREFVGRSAAMAAAGLVAACGRVTEPSPSLARATISARPGTFTGIAPRGFHRFGIWQKEDAFVYVPPSYDDSVPAPFLALLHGAGGRASNFESSLPSRVDGKGIVVMSFNSTVATWDRLALGAFGPDVERMNLALGYVFSRVNVDPTRLAIGGFSDGASYALTLGIPNGDLFTAMIAFSPGAFVAPGYRGKPKAFVSHGTGDSIIPVTNSRDQIVPQLRDLGHTVTYREFTGGHSIPADIANEAFSWLVTP